MTCLLYILCSIMYGFASRICGFQRSFQHILIICGNDALSHHVCNSDVVCVIVYIYDMHSFAEMKTDSNVAIWM